MSHAPHLELTKSPLLPCRSIDTIVPYNNKCFPACESVMILDIMRPKTSCSWLQNSAASKANEHPSRCLCASTLPSRFISRAAFAPPWRLNSATPFSQPSPFYNHNRRRFTALMSTRPLRSTFVVIRARNSACIVDSWPWNPKPACVALIESLYIRSAFREVPTDSLHQRR